MAFSFQDMVEEARLSARALIDYGEHFFNPTVRLGVTGLSRAGKTVFITALIHGLTRGGRFPVFEAYASGRIARAHLAPQPDDAVPRFSYESHLRALIEERRWPSSTVDISELRLVIDYQRPNGADRTLTLDIVDYPGEWLLDLPLLQKSFEQWSAESLALSREAPRAHLAADWHAHLATLKPEAREDEQATLTAAKLFTGYLRACRDERFAMSLLPPGRFLMPGSLADTPALTFAPLDVPVGGQAPEGSLWAMMVRRYEAYKDVVVRPFFQGSFCPARSPDRAGRCALRIQLRPRGAARSRSRACRHSRLLQHRPQHDPLQPVQAAHRPHPVRGDQGGPSASFQPRPARGRAAPRGDPGARACGRYRRADRRGRARRRPRHPRGPGHPWPRQIALDPGNAGRRRKRRRRVL